MMIIETETYAIRSHGNCIRTKPRRGLVWFGWVLILLLFYFVCVGCGGVVGSSEVEWEVSLVVVGEGN